MSTSVNDGPTPDLFIVAVPAYFAGYYPGYARASVLDAEHWTFVVLKMKSRNNAGTVTLRSLDPFDQPEINFNNFAIGGDLDAQAVAEGIQRARDIYKAVIPLDGSLDEVFPGPQYPAGYGSTLLSLKKRHRLTDVFLCADQLSINSSKTTRGDTTYAVPQRLAATTTPTQSLTMPSALWASMACE